jgi:hypothetical protein
MVHFPECLLENLQNNKSIISGPIAFENLLDKCEKREKENLEISSILGSKLTINSDASSIMSEDPAVFSSFVTCTKQHGCEISVFFGGLNFVFCFSCFTFFFFPLLNLSNSSSGSDVYSKYFFTNSEAAFLSSKLNPAI